MKDPSGGVLPGVTVEAASPVLIEKVRTATTDGAGLYRIEDLRPGAYTVTFTLPGFSTVKRDGIQLGGTATVVVNADLRVGALEETVTVTGESPTVDVQSTTSQRVLDKATLDAIPTGRAYANVAVLVPGVSSAGGGAQQDVGGSTRPGNFSLVAHGSRATDMRIMQNGVSLSTLVTGGSFGQSAPNMGAYQEVAIDTGAVSAENPAGGPRLNFIPREGGNQFKGSTFFGISDESLQGSNLTQRVKDLGLLTADAIKRNWDINPGFGGPLKQDKLWFYFTAKVSQTDSYTGGVFYNKNAGNPNAYTYDPDLTKPGINSSKFQDGQVRMTYQASPKNKFAFTYNQQNQCSCARDVGTPRQTGLTALTFSPEAAADWRVPTQQLVHGEWNSPRTNRLLLEVVALHRTERYIGDPPQNGDPGRQFSPEVNALLIPVVDQATGMIYRQRQVYTNTWTQNWFYRAAASYVTGTHSFKAGFNNVTGELATTNWNFSNIEYRVNTVNGVTTPNQVTIKDTPNSNARQQDADLGFFAQDKWTISKATMTLGIRYDHFASSFPEQVVGSTALVPNRNLVFPAQDNLKWNDISSRFGIVYDLFGNGKTALKASANKYLKGQALDALASTPNPTSTLVLSANRSWNDANKNWVPDCNLTAPAANGECGALSNALFGSTRSDTTFDPALLQGWGKRDYNWEFTAGVQHELLPRLGLDVGFFRRIYGNFQVTDNTLVGPADFDTFSITAPVDSRLPNGGGYAMTGLLDLKPSKVGQVQNYVTLSDNYAKVIEHWNGVDITMNARLSPVTVQGGISTGRTSTDRCDLWAKLPELAIPTPGLAPTLSINGPVSGSYCKLQENMQTQVKVLGMYTIPKVDVQMAGTYQSLPGPQVNAIYNAPSALAAPSLGRPLSGGANTAVDLVAPGTMFGERVNQLDMRFGKVFSAGRTRTVASVDLYNALNVDTIVVQNDAFASWQRPQMNIMARFVKFSVQFDF